MVKWQEVIKAIQQRTDKLEIQIELNQANIKGLSKVKTRVDKDHTAIIQTTIEQS